MDLLADLNPPQRTAAAHAGGPLLILAGAGSGKTRVLAYRITYLVRHRNVPPARILAVTFTDKPPTRCAGSTPAGPAADSGVGR